MIPEQIALETELRHRDIAAEEARERRAVRHARIVAFCLSWAVAIVLAALGVGVWDWAKKELPAAALAAGGVWIDSPLVGVR